MSNLWGEIFAFECEAPHRPTIDVKQQKVTTFAAIDSFEVEVNDSIDLGKDCVIHLMHKLRHKTVDSFTAFGFQSLLIRVDNESLTFVQFIKDQYIIIPHIAGPGLQYQ